MPHQQGAMDGLCGAYSIVNAMKLLRHDNYEESKELFERIIYHLDEKRELPKIILKGMTIGVLFNIINDVIPRDEIKRSMPFRGNSASLGELWGEMENFMNDSSNGVSAIIIGIFWDEDHGHWSVVRKITNKTIILEDSDGMRRLHRSRITTCDPKANRWHCINPSEVIFLNNPNVTHV